MLDIRALGGEMLWLWLFLGSSLALSFGAGLADRKARSRKQDKQEAKKTKKTKKAKKTSVDATSSKPTLVIEIEDEPALPRVGYEEDEAVDPTKVGEVAVLGAPALPVLYDQDAAVDEPTHAGALIVTSAFAQSDTGRRRKRNEDSVLVADDDGLYVVADGMGGYSGGEVASNLAVETIATAFKERRFEGPAHADIPKRASELARAIQMANLNIHKTASSDPRLEGMGTTVCAARFSSNKQRLYVGHVGDSRIYRLRDGQLKQMTADHTMKDLGVEGPTAAHLSRAVGVWPTVPIDVVLAKPMPGDVYLLCSDGLTKMVSNDVISQVLAHEKPNEAAGKLVHAANENGGKDNISVIVVQVHASRMAA